MKINTLEDCVAGHSYIVASGSVFADPNPQILNEISTELNEWCTDTLRNRWVFSQHDHMVVGDELKLLDVVRYLVISFDDPDDAMLCRMTWKQLTSPRNDKYLRGLLRQTG